MALEELIARHGLTPGAEGVPSEAAPSTLTTVPQHSSRVWGFEWPSDPDASPSAVLILFGALDEVEATHPCAQVHAAVDVLLTQRAATLRTHAGQVAFPGGRLDAGDGDVIATALREAQEETGLDPAGVDVLGVLPPVPVSVSGYVVHPVIGWWRDPSQVAVVDQAEASAVFRVPVADLVAPENRFRVTPPGRPEHVTPGFEVDGRFIWGFTAALLNRVLRLLRWDQAWDTSVVLDSETRKRVR